MDPIYLISSIIIIIIITMFMFMFMSTYLFIHQIIPYKRWIRQDKRGRGAGLEQRNEGKNQINKQIKIMTSVRFSCLHFSSSQRYENHG